jgi:choline dehydrogenase-like flavoprotein
MPSPHAPVFNSLLRYSSGLDDAGPNDLQIVWFDAVGPDDASLAGGRIIGALMRVFSSGVVRLRSSNPRVDPIVEFGMLADPRDRHRLRGVVHQMLEIARHPMVASINTAVVALTTPLDELASDAAIDRWLRANVTDYVHAVGTCRMGSRDDPAAVVDTDCRVIGYDGLRVCDASVMPDLPKANTHLTTVAIAERLVERMRA